MHKKIVINFEGKYGALNERTMMSGGALELGREIKSVPGVSSILRTTVVGAVRRRNREALISLADRSAGGGGVFGPLAFTSDV